MNRLRGNLIKWINKNEWNDKTYLQALIKDIKIKVEENIYLQKYEDYFKLTLSQSLYFGEHNEKYDISLDDVKYKIDNSVFGKLIAVTDIEAMKIAQKSFGESIENLDIRINSLEKDKTNTNTLLIAPDIETLNTSQYDEVFILSTYDVKDKYNLLHTQSKVYIINHNNIKKIIDEFCLDVDKLRRLFINIKKSIINNTVDNELLRDDEFSIWEKRAAVKIFMESGLIIKNKTKPIYLLTNKKKADIEKSETYKNFCRG